MKADSELCVVTMTPDGVAAAVIKGRLEAAGIPAMLRSYDLTSWLFPGGPSGFGAVEVMVSANRLAEAQRLIAGE